jgi:hypothetical protein
MSTLNDSRQAGLEHVLALDDRSYMRVRPMTSSRLDRQELLQRVGGAVGLHRPDLHLAEALTAELRLATQRLLGDEEYGPIERAWILSSTRWCSFSMYITPTVTSLVERDRRCGRRRAGLAVTRAAPRARARP